MKKNCSLLIIALVLSCGCLQQENEEIILTTTILDDGQTPTTAPSLSQLEIEALNSAIDDEYKARATYAGVIEKFGDVRPFNNIMNAEQQHIEALKRIYSIYNLEVPEDPWTGNVPEYGTLAEACDAGANAEIENIRMYERLLVQVENPDVLETFKNLQKASLENHLPAFQRCGTGR